MIMFIIIVSFMLYLGDLHEERKRKATVIVYRPPADQMYDMTPEEMLDAWIYESEQIA